LKRINSPRILVPATVFVIYALVLISGATGLTSSFDSAASLLIATTVLQIAVFILPCIFYSRLRRTEYVKTYNLRPFKLSRLILIIAALGVMITGVLLINVGIFAASGDTSMLEGGGDSISGIKSGGGFFLTALTVCIMPAICEEFAFRGFVLGEYYNVYGGLPAVIASTLLFALAHFNGASLVTNLFCGLILSIVLVATKSLLAPTVLHTAYNLVTVFLMPYVRNVLFEPLGPLFTVYICAGLFLLFLTMTLAELQHIYHEYARSYDYSEKIKRDEQDRPPLLKGTTEVIFSVTFLACVALSLLFTFVIHI